MSLPRLHLFEFNDQVWVPGVLRDAMTGYLETLSRWLRFHESMVAILDEVLERSGEDRIVDLCSGSGGPILEIRKRLARPVSVTLTDKFPNRSVFERLALPGVTGRMDPIDATGVPTDLGGVRTLINAFHHFLPDAARRILADAASRRAPLVVIETPRRSIGMVLTSPLIVPFVLVVMPFVRPTRWQYWVFTYLLPILPLMVFWDGLVSHLRTYSLRELERMTHDVAVPGYTWEVREVPLGSGVRATVVIGLPGVDESAATPRRHRAP